MREVSIKEAQVQYGLAVDESVLGREPILLRRDGQPVAAIVPIAEYEAFCAWREAEERRKQMKGTGIVMAIQTITLHLPEAVMRRAKQAANVLQRPLEEVLTATLAATLPDVEDAPPDMQAELARMTWLNDQELWTIARGMMPEERQEQLRYLTELQVRRPLTQDEQETLDALRQEYGRVTLRKARAYAVLSLRGGRPLLAGGRVPS